MCGGVATSRVTARSLMVISTPPRDIVSSSSEGVPTSLTVSIMPPQTILSGWGRRNFRGRRSRAEEHSRCEYEKCVTRGEDAGADGGSGPVRTVPLGLGVGAGDRLRALAGPRACKDRLILILYVINQTDVHDGQSTCKRSR